MSVIFNLHLNFVVKYIVLVSFILIAAITVSHAQERKPSNGVPNGTRRQSGNGIYFGKKSGSWGKYYM